MTMRIKATHAHICITYIEKKSYSRGPL